MGTTVTSNLALIKPDTDESIREDLPTFAGWAAQNEDNMDVIDSLFRSGVSNFTPVWGATTTPPTLGASGLTAGKVVRLYPRIVGFFFRIQTGFAGFLVGTGTYTIDLPVAVDPTWIAANFTAQIPVGKMIYKDDNAVLSSSVFGVFYNPVTNRLLCRPSQGGTWNPTTPIAPQQNDFYSGYAIYPTAVV